jgi:hypothetical protein
MTIKTRARAASGISILVLAVPKTDGCCLAWGPA